MKLWSVEAASREWGLDDETLKRRLVAAGFTITRRCKFNTREITAAIVGDLDREKILEKQDLRAERRRKRAIEDGNLIALDDAQRLIREAIMPVRQRLLALAAEAAPRCNPENPQAAFVALTQWTEEALPVIRAGITNGNGEKVK